jgi:hypothetical protein
MSSSDAALWDASFRTHRELKVGTLSGVLKQAGIPHDEFVAVARS